MSLAVIVDQRFSRANQIKQRIDWDRLGLSVSMEFNSVAFLEKLRHLRPAILLLGDTSFCSQSEIVAAVNQYDSEIPIVLFSTENDVPLALPNVTYCSAEELTMEYLQQVLRYSRETHASHAQMSPQPAYPTASIEERLKSFLGLPGTFYIIRIVMHGAVGEVGKNRIGLCFSNVFESLLIDWFSETDDVFCVLLRDVPEQSILYSIKVLGELIAALYHAIQELGFALYPICVSERVSVKTMISAYRNLIQVRPLLYFYSDRLVVTEAQLRQERKEPDYDQLDREINEIQCGLIEGNAAAVLQHIDTLYRDGIQPAASERVLMYCRARLENCFRIFFLLQRWEEIPELDFSRCRFLEEERHMVQEYVTGILSDCVPRNAIHPRILQALQYIFQNYQEDLSQESIATQVQLSAVYFSKLFKADVGVGFIEFLTDLRIRQARNLFDSGQKNVQHVAASVGIGDPKYFSRVFKRKCGISPTEYLALKEQKP